MYSDYIGGKLIVALDKNYLYPATPESDINKVLKEIDYDKIELIYRSEQKDEKDHIGDIILVYLKNKDKIAVMEAIGKLSMNPDVIYAEPDYLEYMHVIPNDTFYNQLWGTQRVDAPLAWNYTTGNFNVSVGVIDTGVDYNHPDIQRNMWVSPDNRIKNGWNFIDYNQDPMDTNGHGTHAAGTIGAVGNNYIGITGICWNIKVAALKFNLDIASAIASIYFANQFHIPILNASWGGPSYSKALKYAIDHYDGLFIASAGNNGTNNDLYPIYPASYDSENIISVAATSPSNNLASFSNYGVETVDIAAPGTDILSLGLNNEYSTQNGTSMSAPHVAGAAALLKSYLPDISTIDLKNLILSSVVPLPSLNGKTVTGGILNINKIFQKIQMRH